MKANETTVRDLLQGERQFVVPLYQRRYSWKRDDLRKLWDDLARLTDVDDGDQSTHFLGSVVLAPSPQNTPTGVQVWVVVDGQQRLTTLSLLLCAIRDHVRERDPRLAEKIDDLYLFNRHANGQERYTLLPTQADRDAWTSLLERSPDAGGVDRIGEAYRFFRKELLRLDDLAEEEPNVARLERAVASRLSIVEIVAHRGDNVHRIFESLNHTGQLLTQADLLRNYLFMRLPTRGEHVYTHRWLPLQELLTDKQLEELIWLDLVLRGDDRATQDGIYEAQQRRLEHRSGERDIEQWIEHLHRTARLFHRILAPDTEPSVVLSQALDRLHRWRATVVYPVALHVMLAHDDGQLDASQAAQALRVVESYLVRRMIMGIGASNSNRVLMSAVKDLGEAVPTAEALTRVLSTPRKKFPTDAEIRDAVLSNSFYWNGRGPQRMFVLRCLEEDYRHEEPPDFAQAKLTIEHIMPQSPSQEWWTMLGTEVGEGETVEELHSSLVQTLGNLTLTAYNASLGNEGFESKKKILADSGLAMNRELAEHARWGREEILQRGRSLADRIVRIWPGPDESVKPTQLKPRWSLMHQILASIPAGRWTSYSDLAEVIGSHQVAVGARMSGNPAPNAHRVLKLHGTVSPDFRWPDPARSDDPRDTLRAEGVRFDEHGRAAADQRMTAMELAELVDLDTAE